MSKIKFDIKYRPDIEAGTYKVKVGGHDARIVCWDYTDDNALIVFVKYDGAEQALLYDANGHHRALISDKMPDLELYTNEPELTQFERALGELLFHFCDPCPDNEFIKTRASEILELAKKELLSYADESNPKIEAMADLERAVSCGGNLPLWLADAFYKKYLEGYAKGLEDAEKRHKEATSFHYDLYHLLCPPPYPLCYVGGPCTNPHHDCINCPRTGTSGIAKTDTNIK